jgi:hypothetical protein
VSATLHIRDFRGPLQKYPSKSLDGLSSKTEVLGMGKATWEVQDFYGVKITITTMKYHIEKGMPRLTLGDGAPLTFPYQPGSKLRMMMTSSHFNNPTTKVGLTFEDTNMLANLTVANEVNKNLPAAKRNYSYGIGSWDMLKCR